MKVDWVAVFNNICARLTLSLFILKLSSQFGWGFDNVDFTRAMIVTVSCKLTMTTLIALCLVLIGPRCVTLFNSSLYFATLAQPVKWIFTVLFCYHQCTCKTSTCRMLWSKLTRSS